MPNRSHKKQQNKQRQEALATSGVLKADQNGQAVNFKFTSLLNMSVFGICDRLLFYHLKFTHSLLADVKEHVHQMM